MRRARSRRAAELATLRATGWSEAHLRRLVATEGAAIGTAGAVAGTTLGLVTARLAFDSQPLELIWLLPAGALLGAVSASLAPMRSLAGLPTAALLAEE